MQLGAVKIDSNNIICAMGNDSGEIMSTAVFPVSTQEKALEDILAYYKTKRSKGIGIAVSQCMDTSWDINSLLKSIDSSFKCPVAYDTLGNCTILGENTFGSCKGLKNCMCMISGDKSEIGVIFEGKQVKNLQPIELSDENVDKLIEDYKPEKIVTEADSSMVLKGALIVIRKVA